MLSDLFEIDKWILEALANGRHSAQSCPLELLALEQTLAIFQQADIIAGNGLNERLGGGKLAKGDPKMTALPLSILSITTWAFIPTLHHRECSASRGETGGCPVGAGTHRWSQ
jgi:hypothetical protein